MNRWLLIPCFIFLSGVCFADSEKSFWQQVKTDFTAPVETSSGQTTLIAGTLLTTALAIEETQIDDPLQKKITQEKPLGKYSKYGDQAGQLYPNVAYILGMTAYSQIYSDKESQDFAFLMLKASLYSSLTSTILKTAVREPRPYDSNVKTSFPSGHATTAFAFAATVGSLHEWYWGAAAYSLATFVAFSRINDNQHYLHDVVAGATIGTAYGLGLVEQFKNEKKNSTTDFLFLPTLDGAQFKVVHFF